MNAETSRPVKRERSPSPVLKEPITSGAKRYPTLPFECTKKSPRWFEARRKWIKEETRKLSEKGLTVKRAHFRDDGLVLDWESLTPVWPGTLLPAVAPKQQCSNIAPRNASCEDEDTSTAIDTTATDLDRELSRFEDMAVEYLKLYTEAFDTDRATLLDAYSSNATFSYCIHDVVSLNTVAANFMQTGQLQRFASRKGARNMLKLPQAHWETNLHRGPSAIVCALKAIGPHKFCAWSPTDINYSVVAMYLGNDPHVLLTCNGHLTEVLGKRENRLSFDQSFILRLPDGSAANSTKGAWPLVTLCHQLTLRE